MGSAGIMGWPGVAGGVRHHQQLSVFRGFEKGERQAGAAIFWHILVIQQVNESASDLDLLGSGV